AFFAVCPLALAQEFPPAPKAEAKKLSTQEEAHEKLVKESNTADIKADSAWIIVATALVMLMVPGLALFYGGMVRRKNVLATMMQSMVALAIVGVYWMAVGYSLAFGKPVFGSETAGILGWNWKLVFLSGIE